MSAADKTVRVPDSPLAHALSRCDSVAAILLNSDALVVWADTTARGLLEAGDETLEGQAIAWLLVDAVEEDGSPSKIGIELTDLVEKSTGVMAPRTIGLQVNDHMRWVELQALGADAGVVTVFLYDVTVRVELEHGRLRDVSRNDYSQHLQSMGDMAAGIADDFNNLLLSILGKTALMLMDLPADSPWREGLQGIEGHALQAGELSNQMLAWAGRIRPATEPLNLSLLIDRMDYLMRAALPAGVALHRNCDGRLPEVSADAVQIRQLVLGLLSNACDAMEDRQGVVTVTTGCMRVDDVYLEEALAGADAIPGRYVCMEVSDNGIGIADELKNRIFDPFFTTKESGRGLGLAAALGIVRGHNGAMRVDSGVGRGTTVTVLLPVVESSGNSTAKSTDDGVRLQAVSGELATVLVIEEDDNVRQIAGRILARFGWQIALAGQGADALDLLKAQPGIRVALMDLSLADYDADELSRAMREVVPEIRILATSGYLDREEVTQLQRDGLVDGYIQKPYTPIALMARIREVSGR